MNKPDPTTPSTTQPTTQATKKAAEQRSALEKSEKQATRTEPQNYRDKANDDKVVEIGPDVEDAPIEGLDPKDRGRHAR